MAACTDLVGATVALRLRLEGEPFRIRFPIRLPLPMIVTSYGTALSGPLAIDGLLAAATCRSDAGQHANLIRRLGWLRVVGVLSEPATWGRRPHRWTVAISAAQLAAALALIAHRREAGFAPEPA